VKRLLVVVAVVAGFAGWVWWQATRPVQWDNLRDGGKR
jgi:hypothetical protein